MRSIERNKNSLTARQFSFAGLSTAVEFDRYSILQVQTYRPPPLGVYLNAFLTASFGASRLDTIIRAPSVGLKPDTFDGQLYEAVGVMMTAWEWVELRLSMLYSAYVGYPEGDALFQYGDGRIFRERISALRRVAEQHFVAYCSQDREAAFTALALNATDLANRRNEIAHGVVLDVTKILPEDWPAKLSGEENYFLVPHAYAFRRSRGPNFYSYSSSEIIRFVKCAREIEVNALECLKSIPLSASIRARNSSFNADSRQKIVK